MRFPYGILNQSVVKAVTAATGVTHNCPEMFANPDADHPLTWESACAAGDYDQQATTLARNLVSHGAGGIVIRLGTAAARTASWTASSHPSNWP